MFSGYLSTSFNMTCELLKLMQDFLHEAYINLNLQQVCIVNDGLEIAYWHAVSFNEQLSLRMRLRSMGVSASSAISKFPHLIDQEATSLSIVLQGLLSKFRSFEDTSTMDDSQVFLSNKLER
jgi:hypothetical protein